MIAGDPVPVRLDETATSAGALDMDRILQATLPTGRVLTKAMRLRRRREFVAVSAENRKVSTRHFIALLAPRPSMQLTRVGLTVTKKVGHSPTRNRIRRFAREWLRTNGWFAPGWDVVLIAKHSAAQVRRRDEFAADLRTVQAKAAIPW